MFWAPVGAASDALAADPKAFVANFKNNSVSVIDTVTPRSDDDDPGRLRPSRHGAETLRP